MKTLLLVGVLLLAGPPLPVRAQAISSRDLTDVANDRPYSALNLNRADAATRAAAEAEANHPIHYFTPDWRPGQVLGIDGQAQAGPGGLQVLPVGSIRGFVLAEAPGQPAYRFGAYFGPGGEGRLFMKELTPAGPLHLLVRFDVESVAPVRNAALAVDTRAGYERQFTCLYVADPAHGKVRELPLTQKAVLKMFGERAPQMAAYATEKNLRYPDIADVAELV